jgi:hypothetical protein
MPVTIEEVTAELSDPPPATAAQPPRRPPPDMPRIIAELRRAMEREQRLWCD